MRACVHVRNDQEDGPTSVRPSDDLGASEVVDNQHAWQARGRKDGRTAADGEIISPLPYAAAVAIIPRSPARARSQDWQIFITWRQAMRTIRVCTGWTSPSAIATTGLGGCRGGVGTRPGPPLCAAVRKRAPSSSRAIFLPSSFLSARNADLEIGVST